MNKEIIALIPVKGNSDRVKKKNLRKFGNTTLLELKLSQLRNCQGFSDIVVSSECDEVLSISKKNGFSLHERNPKYSTSDIPMSDVYSYIASEIKGENIAWINVTNPLAETVSYENAIKIFNDLDSKHDCLLSVAEVKDYLIFKDKPLNFKPYPWQKSQDLLGVYELTFVINILKREDMISWGSCVGNNPFYYKLDKISSWDIDFKEDFDFCEMIYTSNNRYR